MQSSPMAASKKGKAKTRARSRKRKRRYSPEFKEKAVKLALRGDRPMVKVATELGVPSQTLYTWVWDYERDHGSVAPEGETLEQKVKRLEKDVARLEEEREILKKAATFFAKENE
jgi:transposase